MLPARPVRRTKGAATRPNVKPRQWTHNTCERPAQNSPSPQGQLAGSTLRTCVPSQKQNSGQRRKRYAGMIRLEFQLCAVLLQTQRHLHRGRSVTDEMRQLESTFLLHLNKFSVDVWEYDKFEKTSRSGRARCSASFQGLQARMYLSCEV